MYLLAHIYKAQLSGYEKNHKNHVKKSDMYHDDQYTRHTSSCMCVGFPRSPQSLTGVSSWGFAALPPSCNSNYLGYRNHKNHNDH
jgi:hypothetical protein